MWGCGILVLFLLGKGSFACTRDELEMVQIISAHGSFAPSYVYQNDPNPASVWKEGLNDITMLGKFQAFALGVVLRNFYNDFITSDPREVEVFSSSNKGIVKSAQSLLTALYTPTTDWEIVQNFSWQPVYINYNRDENKFLSETACPSAETEYQRMLFRETGALLQTYQDIFNYWSLNSGMNLKTIADVERLYNILYAEITHNLTIPDWSKAYWDEMKYIHDISSSLRTKTRKLKAVLGGPLTQRSIQSMREKSIKGVDDPKKVIVYSTSPLFVTAFLETLELGSFKNLPPCASVLLELYKKEGQHFVRFLYLNSTIPEREPQEMYSVTLPGCVEFCPLSYVMDYSRNIIPSNLEQECLLT